MNYAALETFIEKRRFEPFAWGSNDCALFAADAVLALTGRDYAQGWRGYRNEFGAIKRIVQFGGLDQMVGSQLREINPLLARRGDPILFEARDGDALGICIGDKFAAVGLEGLVFFPMSQCKRAWSCRQQ